MKKLLSLIGAISIVGSGASTVISCGSSASSTNSDQAKANAIKDKIKNVDLKISGVSKYAADDPNTATMIKTALQTANPTLTKDDLAKITFNKVKLLKYNAVSVTATIKVGKATVKKDLNVTVEPTDQENADEIRDKITNVNLTVPADTIPDTSNVATITAIKTALQSENTTLTSEDLAKINFAAVTLKGGESVEVTTTIRIDTATATKDLNVTLAQTDQQKADAIKDKIINADLTVPVGTDPNTMNNSTISAIRSNLRLENSSLTTPELEQITFSDTTLQAGSPVEVIATITVGTRVANKTLNVTLAQTDQQKADAIKDKIIDVALTVPVGTSPDTANPNTITAIKDALQAANPTLTDPDLRAISFGAVSAILTAGKPLTMTATITVGTGVATKELNVTLAKTDEQKANAIKDKITNDTFNVPAGTNPDTSNAATITAIKTALQNANSTLTTEDLGTITFASTTLQDNIPVAVQATITVGTETATKGLIITLAETDQQKVDAIKAKITNVDLTLVSSVDTATTNPDTDAFIGTALISENQSITSEDLGKISYADTTLQAGQSVVVVATIAVGTASDTINLNVTIAQTDQQKADAIKDRIFNRNINIDVISGQTASFYSTDTFGVRDLIKLVLRQRNSLSDDEVQALSVERGVQLSSNTPQSIFITATVGGMMARLEIFVTLILY